MTVNRIARVNRIKATAKQIALHCILEPEWESKPNFSNILQHMIHSPPSNAYRQMKQNIYTNKIISYIKSDQNKEKLKKSIDKI